MAQTRVDLNADVGESFGPWTLGQDRALFPYITSANIACGFHAGDAGVMRATVELAREHGVAVGAHPGFPDLQGFGRREMRLSPREVEDLVVYQIGALAAVAAAQGVALRHVKVHGALYNMAAADRALADAVARATAAVDHALVLLGLPGSELIRAGEQVGLVTASEVFADRAYRSDGSLVPRRQAGALIEDEAAVSARAVAMVRAQAVVAQDGTCVPLKVDTICLHGDTPGAARLAARVREALRAAAIDVAPL
jgi:5-oxoprolinase (ATP-hydrolysing) subunit A